MASNADRTAVALRRGLLRRVRARLVPLREESGFSLMEAVLAMMLFAIIATAMLSVLTAGVSAQRLSRQRTIAEQAATAQAEYIRTLSYASVGNPGGNPSGVIPVNQTIAAVLGGSYPGLQGNVNTKVEWNNNPSDKVATAYRNAAFYKKVTITVTRTSDNKQLTQVVTFVSNVNNGSGVNEAEIDLSVTDIGNNTPVAGQLVNLLNGPSSPLSDTTDAGGNITFPALTANPTSGPTAYYDLSMAPLAGYTLLKDDDITKTPSSPNAHIQLAPSQTFPTTLRMYKGSQITVNLQDQSTGLTYLGAATITLSTTLRGTPTSQSFAYPNGPMTTSTFSGENIIPTPSPIVTGGYTASVSNGFFATSVNKATVPNAYPSDLTSTFTLVGYPTGTLTATVTWAGSPVSGATVTLTGGPTATNQSAATNALGVATFTDVPAGAGYNLSAQKGGQTSATVGATVVAGTTTNVPIAMPTGSVAVTVTSAGNPIVGATVTLTGGNISGTITAAATTDVNGQVTIPNVPSGSGVTVTATKGAQSGSTSGVTVPNGSTVSVSVLMPLGSIAVTVTWAGSPVANCVGCVTLSGGALGSPVTGDTDATGKVTFINVPATGGYTVSVTKGGQTGTQSGISVTGGSTTNVTVTMPVGTVTVTVNWAGAPLAGATVQLSGGNITGTITAGSTTNGSGQVVVNNVPSGSGVTVTATKGGQTGTTSGVTVPNGSNVNVTVNMPVGTLAVSVLWAGLPVANCANCVTVSGGNLAAPVTGSTDASGNVTFNNVPAGSGYTVSATKSGQTGTAAGVTVTGGSTTNVTVNMPVGVVQVSVLWVGAGVANCASCVTLSGGNLAAPVTGSTDASGNVTFSNVPAGSGYTVTVVKNAQTGTSAGNTVTNGSTTNVTVNMPTGTITPTVTWAGQPITGATVTITGGPNSPTTYSGSTNASGQVAITVPATTAAFPYTVTATKNNGSGNVAVSPLATGATATPAIALGPTKIFTLTIQKNGAAYNNSNVTISITGGPGGTVGALPAWGGALTTNATSKVTVTVPQGTGAFTYTIRAYITGCGTARSGVTAAVSDNAATTTATVNMATASCPGTTP